jgi:hypothetical protein
MEEIERSQGVTIVEVDERPSIGEEVEEAPPPPPASEESEVQEGLAAVADALELADPPARSDEAWAVETEVQEEPPRAEEEYETEEHGLVPVPPADNPAAAWQMVPVPEEEGVRAGEEELRAPEEAAAPAEEAEVAAPEETEAPEAPQADGYADEDPYAQGGLLRRIQEETPPERPEPATEDERPFTTFDWRGRPLS